MTYTMTYIITMPGKFAVHGCVNKELLQIGQHGVDKHYIFACFFF